MSARSISPTRSGLVQASLKLDRVRKGHELLNRKREALIGELFKSARPALDARKRVEERASQAYRTLLHALAARGQASLRSYGWPGREISVELEQTQVWGISVPSVVSHSPIGRTLTARETAAPSVGPAAAQSATEFEQLVELVLDALPKEQLVRRLGDSLAKASRQVNMLQLRVEPRLAAEIRALRGMLDERERDERSRLRHVLRRRKKRL